MYLRDVLSLIEFDSLLSEEEKLIRDTIAKFVGSKIKPYIAQWYEQGISPRELAAELGRLGLLGMHLEGLRMRRCLRCGLRARMHGTGSRRQRTPQLRVGTRFAVDVLDLEIRQ